MSAEEKVSNRNRELKLQYLAMGLKCFWCDKVVKDYGNTEAIRKAGLKIPEDMATIDHMVSRYFRKKGEKVQKVLACDPCNNRRSHEEELIYGKRKHPKIQ